MKEKFFANLAFMVFVNLLIKPFYIFGIDRAVQARVNATEGEGTYGQYFSLYNFAFLFYIILDLGLTDYNKRMVAQRPESLKEGLSDYLSLKIILALVYFLAVFGLAWVVGYRGHELMMLLPLAVVQIFISMIFYFRSNISGLMYFRWDGLFTVLDRLLMIVICSVMLWGGFVENFGIVHFIGAQVASYGISALLSGVLVFHYAGFPKFRLKTENAMSVIRECLPLAMVVLMMAIYTRIDTVMLERMLPDGKEEADVYARGYRLLDAVQGFALLFAGILLPLFSRMLHRGERTEELVRLSFQAILVFSVTTSLACFFYRDLIIGSLYSTAPRQAYTALVFGLLMFTFICISCVYIFGTLLTANFNLRELNIMAFSGVLGNIALNVVLIPEYKALGTTVATLVTQSMASVICIYYAIRCVKLELGAAMWLRITAYSASAALVFWVCSLFITGFVGFLLGGVVALGLAFIFKMLDINSFKQTKLT